MQAQCRHQTGQHSTDEVCDSASKCMITPTTQYTATTRLYCCCCWHYSSSAEQRSRGSSSLQL